MVDEPGKPDRNVAMKFVSELIPYPNNSRTHDDAQVAKLAGLIREYGWTNPVLIDDKNGIIAGHGRLMAARKLAMSTVPCIVLTGLSDAQRRAYIIADNRSALDAGWNEEMLSVEMLRLQEEGFDLSMTGFAEEEISKFLNSQAEGKTDEDEEITLPLSPISKLGDIWLLGKHRVRCGDSTKADDVKSLLNGVQPHLMVTDPPYGVEYDANWRNEVDRANGTPIGGFAIGAVKNDGRSDWSEAWSLFPGNIVYIWHAGVHAADVAQSIEKCGFKIRSQIIWAKNNFVISRGDYHWKHEPCWYAVKGTGRWMGDRSQTTLWQIDKPQKSETGHSTQKPVECMRRPILNNSSPGQAVYDPFLGSGTTVIACETEGRVCYGMELAPEYVDVVVIRWQAFTGQRAKLESTGEEFEAVASLRNSPN